MPKMNNYLPQKAIIKEIEIFTPDIKLYTLKYKNSQKIKFTPGQFLMVSVLGVGESPLGIASSPFRGDTFRLCVRRVGKVTNALDKLKVGDEIGVRGPYGNGFPLKELEGKDILMVAGGTGIAPIVALIEYIISFRPKFNDVFLFYGARTPKDLLFSEEFKKWAKSINLCLTVDEPDKKWSGNTGRVTNLCKNVEIDCQNSKVIICGPPLMYKNMASELKKIGIGHNDIYVSLERRMRCGIGKCQHCVFAEAYVCLNGPVFSYSQIKDLPEEA
jgi:sulfite reductase subunit B